MACWGKARSGLAGQAWCVVAWPVEVGHGRAGVVWLGLVWLARRCVAGSGGARHVLVRQARFGQVRYGAAC